MTTGFTKEADDVVKATETFISNIANVKPYRIDLGEPLPLCGVIRTDHRVNSTNVPLG